jgi:hypothetical protein
MGCIKNLTVYFLILFAISGGVIPLVDTRTGQVVLKCLPSLYESDDSTSRGLVCIK